MDANPLQLLIGFLQTTASVLASKINLTELSQVEPGLSEDTNGGSKQATSPYDMKRLEADTNNLVDFHFIWLVLSNHNYLVWFLSYIVYDFHCLLN